MPLNKTLLFILVGFIISYKASAVDDELCEGKTFFFCTISNGKKLSLCGVEDKSSAKYSIFYRYGRSGNIEITYPSNPTKGNKLFTYVRHHRFQVEYSRVYFNNGGYLYTIYQNYDGSESTKYHAGVVVKNIVTENKTDIQCSVIHKIRCLRLLSF